MSHFLRTFTVLCFVPAMVSFTALAGVDVKVNADTDASIQNEPSITINRHYSGDPLNVVVAYNDIGKTLGISYSADSGKTWADTQLPYVWQTTGDPSVASDTGGNVYACFLSYEGAWFQGKSGIFVSKSVDGGRNWGTPVAADSLAYFPGGPQVPFADKCFMTVDTNSASTDVGNIYVAWQRDDTLGQNSDIYFARSTDGGASFGTPIKINDNPSQTAYAEGAFPFVGADGNVYVAWYDAYFRGHVPGSLYVDKSTDGGQNFGTDIKVTDFLAPPLYTFGNSGFKAKSFPSAAADPSDPEKLYMTYISDPDNYFDRRLDNGKSPALPGGSGPSDKPTIEREGNYVYVAWEDYRNGGQSDIYFNRSTDNGQTWGFPDIGPLDVTDVPGASKSERVQISSSGSHVYAVWQDYRSLAGFVDIYFASSSDYGQTWKSDQHIDGSTTSTSIYPSIASIGNYVYVAWQDNISGNDDIYFCRSVDSGATWGTPTRIDRGDATGANSSRYPRLACIGNRVYCMWLDMRTGSTYLPYFNYSVNNGVTWQSSSVQLSQGSGYWSQMPLRGGVECVGNHVYACWWDDRTGVYEVFFNRSTDSAVTWGTDVRINDSGYTCFNPSMDIQGSYVYIGWEDNRLTGGPSDEIFFDYSSDNGATWQSPDIGPLDATVGLSATAVDIKSDGNYVYATWFDSRFGGPGTGDIFFARSANNGTTWQTDVLINHGTQPFALQMLQYPVMAAGNGHVSIVWSDPRFYGLPNIYANHSSDSGGSWLSGMDEADVFCVRSTDGGATWRSPVTVNDDGTDFAQVLPWVVVKENGLVDISYYNFRMSPRDLWAPGAEVRMAVSMDSGLSFDPSFTVQDTIVTPASQWVGEYNGMAVLDTLAFTVFTDREMNGNSDVYIDRSVNPTPSLDSGEVSLGGLTGPGATGVPSGQVLCGQQFTFNIRLTNSTGAFIENLRNGFEVYSPDGAGIGSVSWAWNPDVDWAGLYFDAGLGISVYGLHSDTAHFMADRADSAGIPNGLDTVIITATTTLDCADTSKTICIDSCHWPGWDWQWTTPGGTVTPTWDGPHCFTIVYGGSSCCADTMVGDINCADDPGVPDVGDMQRLIDFLFIAMDSLCCVEEADVDLSGQAHPPAIEDDVDIGDMQLLIDHLFIDMNPLSACP